MHPVKLLNNLIVIISDPKLIGRIKGHCSVFLKRYDPYKPVPFVNVRIDNHSVGLIIKKVISTPESYRGLLFRRLAVLFAAACDIYQDD
jgi:hypothetical protein